MSSVPPPPPPPTPSEWVVPPEGLVQAYEPPPNPEPQHRPLRWFAAAGLIVAGVLVGGAVAFAVNNHDDGSGSTTSGTAQNGTAQNGAAGGPAASGAAGVPAFGGRDGGPGGVAGEQHVQGTLAAIGTDTVTVTTSSGSTVYSVTGSTQIVRNGAQAGLAQLKVGDPVEAHVLPTSTNGHKQLERLFAGTLPARGGPGDGGGPGGPGA